MTKPNQLLVATALAVVLGAAQAQTKWDMPTAYPATNFHTENVQQFANDVAKASGGKLGITIHANASLFKAPEIKRAVQGGQAQLGEILLVNFSNEDPLYEPRRHAVPRHELRRRDEAVQGVAQGASKRRLGAQGMMLLFTVPWPPQGVYSKKAARSPWPT